MGMKEKILCYPINAVFLKVVAPNTRIYNELSRFFSRKIQGYQFMPKYRMGVWDGTIKFFKQGKLPIGLYNELKDFCKKGGYELVIKNKIKQNFIKVDKEELKEFVTNLNLPYELYDYQFESFYTSLKKRRLVNILPTASGKSLIIYLLTRYFFEKHNYKILIIVPRIQLVEQLFDNFKEYRWKDINSIIGKIYSQAKNKYEDRNIIISTWQSLQKRKPEYFKRFDVLIIDEAHSVKNMNNLVKIATYCENAYYRFGFTGTLSDNENFADLTAVKGYIGPSKQFVDYKTLIENNSIVNFEINIVKIDYPKEEKYKFLKYYQKMKSENLSNNLYQYEIDFLAKNDFKNNFIIDLISKDEKNKIVLFTRIEQGKNLYNIAKKKLQGKFKLFYIDGSVSVDKREEYKKAMEMNNNVIIFASYGTFAEGINIKNVHFVIFASAYKSKIKTLQAIGRGLRLYPNKKLIVIDIVDNLSLNEELFENYSMKHFDERLKIYKKMGFKFKEVDV